ncbi:MAG: hypothetical protein IPJ18_05310 [Betaproteobacteria bacterium]|nr:hypothetical protein [Betaproteobacteria bacterium]
MHDLLRAHDLLMGRKRQGNFDDPPRMHRKGDVWYHVSGTLPRKWTRLSADRAEALRIWAKVEGLREDESTRLFSVVARRYVREVFPTKSVQTRRDNEKELANLLKVFGHMPIDAIAPMHPGVHGHSRGVAKFVPIGRKHCSRTCSIKPGNGVLLHCQNPCQGVKGSRKRA